jgi:hypothetical protein
LFTVLKVISMTSSFVRCSAFDKPSDGFIIDEYQLKRTFLILYTMYSLSTILAKVYVWSLSGNVVPVSFCFGEVFFSKNVLSSHDSITLTTTPPECLHQASTRGGVHEFLEPLGNLPANRGRREHLAEPNTVSRAGVPYW